MILAVCINGLMRMPIEKIDAQFVRDYNTQEWVLVEEATYVYNQSVKTPMAYNVISFKDKADAEKFATENEEVL